MRKKRGVDMRLLSIFALLGISSSALCYMAWRSPNSPQIEQAVNGQNQSTNSSLTKIALKDVRFEPKSALDSVTKEGFRFSSETWEASDGVPVFLSREYCGSSKSADKELRESVKDASKILETKLLRSKNRVAGKRIVASFDNETLHQRIIFWTNGEMLYGVKSSSFEHALLFEKMFPSL